MWSGGVVQHLPVRSTGVTSVTSGGLVLRPLRRTRPDYSDSHNGLRGEEDAAHANQSVLLAFVRGSCRNALLSSFILLDACFINNS